MAEIIFKVCLIRNHKEKSLLSRWVFGDYVMNTEYKLAF